MASTKLADASAILVFLAEECPAATVRMPLRENTAGPCTFSAVLPEAITPVPLALDPLTLSPALRFSPDTALADAPEVSPNTAVPEPLNPATPAPVPLLPCIWLGKAVLPAFLPMKGSAARVPVTSR